MLNFTHFKRIDWTVLIPVALLVFLGLSTLYTITLNVENPDMTLFNKQVIFSISGFILLFLFSFLDYRRLKSYAIAFYILACLSLILVLFFGTTIRGTTGWFTFFGFGLQPVEFAKFVLVIVLAYFYESKQNKLSWKSMFLYSGLITLVPVFLALLQPDFGSAFILIIIWFSFFAITKMKKKYLFFLIIGFVILSIFIWHFVLIDYQKDRILTFIDPMRDPLGKGYNVRQSIIATGSGGLIGRGLGLGTQSQLHFLPEIETDFIFSSICETLGFLGATLMIILYAILFLRLIFIIKKTRDYFGIFIIFGFGIIFFSQTLINMGMNIGIFPVTGLPLPFVSYGGSFLLMCLVSVGLIQSAITHQKVL